MALWKELQGRWRSVAGGGRAVGRDGCFLIPRAVLGSPCPAPRRLRAVAWAGGQQGSPEGEAPLARLETVPKRGPVTAPSAVRGLSS